MQYKLYATNFRKRGKQCVKQHGRCQRCGVMQGALRVGEKSRKWYFVYLQAAHVFANDTMNPNAPLICLCPICHHRFDHPRDSEDWFFIGLVVQQFIESNARRDTDNRTTGGIHGKVDSTLLSSELQ